MSVISVPQAFNEEDLYVDLQPIFGHSLFLKCEGFNFAGSIKLKAAAEMVDAADRDGVLTPGSILVESSSGNLGVALSMIAASKGYRFLCVTDSRCNLSARLLMEALGSEVHVIAEPDASRGFLGARLDYVQALCASDDRYVWLNQYTNPGNWQAHYRTTAPAIARQFPAAGRAVRRGGHDGDPDGLRALLPGATPPGAGGRGGRRRLGDVRRAAGAPHAPRPGFRRPPAAARRVADRRGGAGRRGGQHPGLPSPGPARVPVRRFHRHGGQRRDELAGPARRRPAHRGRHRPRPRRALSRHRLPDQLDRGHLRQGRAPGRGVPVHAYRQTAF